MATQETLRDLIENEIQEQLEKAFAEVSADLWRIDDNGDFEFRLSSGDTTLLEIDKLTAAILEHISAQILA
jgi:hypothetical protein